MDRDGRLDPLNHHGLEGTTHPRDGAIPGTAMNNHLGHQGIVVGRHKIAIVDGGVDPYARPCGEVEGGDATWGGAKGLRIFGVDTTLDRVSHEDQVFLPKADRFPRRDADLCRNQIRDGHLLGHGMLYLDPRIHLHEVELAGLIEQKFDRPRVAVANPATGVDGDASHLLPKLITDRWGRGLFDQLLVATLNRALPFTKVNHVAVEIAQDLDFDVARVDDVPFEIDPTVAKRHLCFGPCRLISMEQLGFIEGDPHPATPSAGRRLDHDRIADSTRFLQGCLLVFDQAVASRGDWNAGGNHRPACFVLVPHHSDHLR